MFHVLTTHWKIHHFLLFRLFSTSFTRIKFLVINIFVPLNECMIKFTNIFLAGSVIIHCSFNSFVFIFHSADEHPLLILSESVYGWQDINLCISVKMSIYFNSSYTEVQTYFHFIYYHLWYSCHMSRDN